MGAKDFILGLKIRVKLLLAFDSILLLSVVLVVFAIRSINKIILYKEINEEADALKLYLESEELAAKEFIYEGYKSDEFQSKQISPFITAFERNSAATRKCLANILQAHLVEDATTARLTSDLSLAFEHLREEFDSLKILLKERGFKDYGLEGSLREAIHQVEKIQYPYNKADMLTLRRNEKDFFLRKDLKYLNDFNKNSDAFAASIVADNESGAIKNQILSLLTNYKAEFNRVADIEVKIGLKEDAGLRGRLKYYFRLAKPLLDDFRVKVREKNQAEIKNTTVTLIVIFSLQLIAGLVLAVLYANALTTAIKEVRTAMQKLANGIFPDKLSVRSSEEIGQTKTAFNQFVDRLKAATQFATKLGEGQLNLQYDSNFRNDVLAESIITMQTKLRDAEERQAKINWANQGAARFNEILKNESEEISVLGDKILKLLVEYLDANQAALYVVDKREECFLRISTYAYGKKKFLNEKIDFGNGLIGQCALERNTIYMREVPADYVRITSGLGEAAPRNILIVPLKIGDEVNGVIELAAFEFFEQHQIEFVEKMAESIASLLANRQSAAETKRLLDESQQRAGALAQQEEEMRQNAEELQATQEEMERQKRELEEEIRSLKQKLKSDRPAEFSLN